MASLSTSLSIRLTRLSRNYDLIAWLLRLILAGGINVYAIQLFGDFVKSYTYSAYIAGTSTLLFIPPASVYWEFWALLAAVLVAPLVLSLILSKRSPQLRIVPPLYIEAIAISWLITFGFDRWSPGAAYAYVFIFGLLLLGIGAAEDRIATQFLGRSVDRDDIQLFKFNTSESVQRVMQVLALPAVRSTLDIGLRTTPTPYGFRIRSPKLFSYRTILKIERFPSQDETEVTMATYEVARYNVRSTPELAHYTLKSRAYLIDICNRSGIVLREDEKVNRQTEPTITEAIRDIQGFYVQSKQLSLADWIRVGFVGAVFVISIVSLLYGKIPEGVLLAIADALVAASELPSIVRRELG